MDLGICASNSDFALLEFSRSLLTNLGFHPASIRLNTAKGRKTNLGVARKSNWLMNVSRLDDVRKFAKEIGFGDSIKQRKLTEALSFLRDYGRAGAATEWMKLYEKYHGDWVRRQPN